MSFNDFNRTFTNNYEYSHFRRPKRVECIEKPTQEIIEPVTIIMSSCSQASIDSLKSTKINNETTYDNTFREKRTETRRLAKTLSTTLVSYRLSRRKILHEQW